MVFSPRSFCCEAPVYTDTSDEGTSCYICCDCHKACDARLTDGRPKKPGYPSTLIGIAVMVAVFAAALFLLSAPSAGKEPDRAPQQAPSVLKSADGGVEKEETGLPATYRTVTAYTSKEEQTDSTPCISANGSDICEMWKIGIQTCAANFVPFGTVLILDNQEEPDGDDAIVCVVADRLASKYPNRVDLYMGYDTARAIEFGKRTMWVREMPI